MSFDLFQLMYFAISPKQNQLRETRPMDRTAAVMAFPMDISLCGYAIVVLTLGYLLYHAFTTDFPKIPLIPEVPHPLPFIGHLHLLGGRQHMNDATVYTHWSSALQSDVFQARLGNQRTLVINSWSAMKELLITNSSALSDRPDQPGFVENLGVDITGTSLTDQIRKCRAAAMRALAKAQWEKYYPLLEPTSVGLVRDMFFQGQDGKVGMDVYFHLRRVVFDLALSLTYGARFGEVKNEFMDSFLWSINAVSAVRNSTTKYRHFVPLLRKVWPENLNETIRAERVRAKHVKVLYGDFKRRTEAGEEVECILSSLKSDKLSEEEMHGTCISLLQAAPDTVASSVYMCIAWLASTAEGRAFQEELYQEIRAAYDGDFTTAWEKAFREEKVPLLVSLYKETLRYYTIAPFSIPRKTSASVSFRGTVIPKGLTVILNSQQVNHDALHFGPEAWSFNPKRYLEKTSPLPHTAFGAGARVCPAVAISNRLVYALLMRSVVAFRMRTGKEGRVPSVHPVEFSDVHGQVVAHPRFFDCCFEARGVGWLQKMVAS